jgi:two-component system NtrC family response regulator
MEREPLKPLALIVDDEPSILKSCEKILQREGFSVRTAHSGPEALEILERNAVDLVFCDLKMPEMTGTDLIATLSRRFPSVVPVVITGYATIASVVETMRLGAYDYLPKPFTPDEMAATARRAMERRRTFLESSMPGAGEDPPASGGVVVAGPVMREVFRIIDKVAPLRNTVLILGEQGVGKETVARAIHERSRWGEGPFHAVDCRRPSPALLDVELFGGTDKQGLLFDAEGTVFLDEICGLGPDLQGRLLHYIHEREDAFQAEPEGTVYPRLMFASGRDLGRMVEQGLFRKDLYYHLYVFPILIPPLRDRREEIPALVRHFLRRYSERTATVPPKVAPEALRLLSGHDWPGNVRQLRGAVEWAASLCGDEPIEPRHLPGGAASRENAAQLPVPRSNQELVEFRKRLREMAVADVERDFIAFALERAGGNISQAARDVGMQRQNFQALMRKHGIRSQGEEE